MSKFQMILVVAVALQMLATGQAEPPEPLATVTDMLRDVTPRPGVLNALDQAGPGECADEIEGQFVFCVAIPTEVDETVSLPDRIEWRPCLVYDERTCCHVWKKVEVRTKQSQTVRKIVMKKTAYCVKISIPKSAVLAAEKCDCPNLPGTALPFISGVQNGMLNSAGLTYNSEQRDVSPELVPPKNRNHSLGLATVGLFSKTDAVDVEPTTSGQPIHVHHDAAAQKGGSILELSNRANRTVEVQRVQFVPRKVFEADGSVHAAFWKRSRESKAETVVLTHNSSKTKGAHGVYTGYWNAEFLPQDARRAITVVVDDRDHFGWGLEGDLVLRTEHGDTTVPNSKVLFVSLSDR